MCFVQINFLVVRLNRMPLGTNWCEYTMGLHWMYVKHMTRNLNNIGVHEILVESSVWKVYVAGCLYTMGGTGDVAKTGRNIDGIDVRCKIVDFGNACWADKQFAEEIQTRQYRAPEVILKAGYSFSVELWA